MTIANGLSGLQGQLYSAVDVVSREMIGYIPAVALNATGARAEVGETIKVPVSTATSGVDITPAMTVPEPANKTVLTRPLIITKSRAYPFGFTGEEALGLDAGAGYQSTQTQEIAQAIRGITNEIEADIAAVAIDSSRAYGVAGTTPFASNLTDTAQILKILKDNGAPVESGWNLVIDSTAGAKMRTLTQLTKANEAADNTMLRQGTLLDIHGGRIRESGQVVTHTAGTGANATTDDAGYAIGDTAITLAAAGTGTIVAGDVIVITGDANKYTVAVGVGAVSGGVITLAEPGLRQAVAASATAITLSAAYVANCGFTSDAIQLALRRPALVGGRDAAVARMSITDPRSGITFEFAEYAGYHETMFEVTAAWGVDMTKEEHAAILLG